MLKKLLDALGNRQSQRPTFREANFGEMLFDQESSTWETASSNPIYIGGIPGTSQAPDSKALSDVKSRLQGIDKYWAMCSDDLQYIAAQYDSIPNASSPKEVFKVAALSLYEEYWEVCFETLPELKWLYIGMQFQDEQLVSNTIDT